MKKVESLINELDSKKIRTITRDINTIFSLKGLAFPKTIDEVKEIGFFAPKVKVSSNEAFLSIQGQGALRRICDIISQCEKFNSLLNYNDIFQCILSEINRWLSKNLVPDAIEFIGPLDIQLSDIIDDYSFVCKVDGISLNNIESLELGLREIKAFESKMLPDLSNIDDAISYKVNEEYGNALVVVGTERGSHSIAQEKFFYNAELSLSVLRLYSCALHQQAIYRVNIRLINNCEASYSPTSSLSWVMTEKILTYTKYFRKSENFEINSEKLNCLESECLFMEISSLIDKENRTELEEAIVKSLFWIGEAQKDQSSPSAWVKLWSCLECFFTLEGSEIIEQNARGVATILIYGGYLHEDHDNFVEVKKKIKKYYRLRSRIVHHAEFTNIDKLKLEELSYIVARVIIVMTSLAQRGVVSLSEIQEQADRLDKENKRNEKQTAV